MNIVRKDKNLLSVVVKWIGSARLHPACIYSPFYSSGIKIYIAEKVGFSSESGKSSFVIIVRTACVDDGNFGDMIDSMQQNYKEKRFYKIEDFRHTDFLFIENVYYEQVLRAVNAMFPDTRWV